jgi:hypothetical protein
VTGRDLERNHFGTGPVNVSSANDQ